MSCFVASRGAVAAAEARHGGDAAAWEAKFYDAMARLEFLPNSPTLMNAGKPSGQLSACFVLPVGDAMPGDLRRREVGGDDPADRRRHRLRVLAAAAVGRRGALDAWAWRRGRCRSSRCSTRRPTRFGRAACGAAPTWAFCASIIPTCSSSSAPRRIRGGCATSTSRWRSPTSSCARSTRGSDYALRNPRSGAEVRRLDARRVWQLIAQLAWKSGEPGVIFIDRINAANPTPRARRDGVDQSVRRAAAVALRGVQPGVDRRRQAVVVDGRRIDWPRLARARRDSASASSTTSSTPTTIRCRRSKQITRGNRKIGLGVMGFADALIRHGRGLRLGGGARRRRRAGGVHREARRRRRRPSWRASGGRSPTGRARAGNGKDRRRCATRRPRPSRRPGR